MSVSQSPRRADAERNRARLVDVARDALRADAATTMQSLARLAGVGQGTLYRHFPTRGALLAEVYRADFQGLVASARALADRPSQDGALRSWLDELAAFGSQKHALADVLDAATRQQLHDEQYDEIADAIGVLLQAGARAGVLRPDVGPADLLALVAFLWRLGPSAADRVPYLLDLVVDGLRPRTADGA
ncbi:TetR/AcrR family transcriptional regulator [Curtobacterium sp. A7_M15]|uniref:TetR/AcrR family transcriptional regulator n=1 Tax=Curtobacterium sp. A7_M15 TaxID=3065241 RepID=UPI002737A933|nr:TetR/AcrR family transcriptional regulator [Curtobacterium sp. A7_M15]MDP4332504.1 TetR/AcrR family transcriptional regulator [Curtobacterium sp. A7_M15]